MKGGKSNAKADNMLGVKNKAPVKIFRELIELSDSEEETVDPFPGSKEVGNTWCSHPGNIDPFIHLVYLICFQSIYACTRSMRHNEI